MFTKQRPLRDGPEALGRFIELCLSCGSANEEKPRAGTGALSRWMEKEAAERKAGRREGGGSVARYGDR